MAHARADVMEILPAVIIPLLYAPHAGEIAKPGGDRQSIITDGNNGLTGDSSESNRRYDIMTEGKDMLV